jgi:transcriptional regulator with XRE-family HTH domain
MECRTAHWDGGSIPPAHSREVLARTPAQLLGDEVRAFREQRGLSLSQVAGLVFASKSLISAIEHGQRTGTPKLIAAVDVVLAAAGRIEALWPAAATSRRGPGRPSSCPTCQRGRPDVEGIATQAVALAERALGHCADRGRFVSGRLDHARAQKGDRQLVLSRCITT